MQAVHIQDAAGRVRIPDNSDKKQGKGIIKNKSDWRISHGKFQSCSF